MDCHNKTFFILLMLILVWLILRRVFCLVNTGGVGLRLVTRTLNAFSLGMVVRIGR